MPTVQPSRAACATIWSVVWIEPRGRRIFGIASIVATSAKRFIAIGIERSLSRRSSSAARAGPSTGVPVGAVRESGAPIRA